MGAASALAWARIFQRVLDSGEAKHRAALADLVGVSKARVTEVMNLLRLDPAVQQELLAGAFGPISDHPMREVVKLEGAAAQRAALQAYAQSQLAHPTGRQFRPRKLRTTETHPIRRVAYFNPEMFVRQRLRDRRRRRAIEQFVGALNEHLRSPRSRRDESQIRFAIMRRLSRDNRLSLYDLELPQQAEPASGRAYWQAALQLKTEAWRRRRRYHGFVLLVGHQDLHPGAADLAHLYRAKDAVERDFRVIKSEVELRPLYHRTDPKVRAHVTLCMLALLVKRALESKLEAAGRPQTAAAVLEALSHCPLNRYEQPDTLGTYYAVTRPNAEQTALLKALGLTALTDDRKLAQRLMPRGA